MSLWEIGLKMSRSGFRDLQIPEHWETDFPDKCRQYAIQEIPIRPEHYRRIQHLDFHHADPFDRMLVAQALEANLAVITSDRIFEAYGVKRVW